MQRWWLFTVRGVFAVLFGLAALVWPGLTLLALIILWGAYALFDGAMMLYLTLTHKEWPHAGRSGSSACSAWSRA